MSKPFHQMHPESRNRRVHEFLVWRAGQSVNWECTQEEIAREIGVSPMTVSLIFNAKGWKTYQQDRKNGFDRMPVDAAMRSTDKRILSRV